MASVIISVTLSFEFEAEEPITQVVHSAGVTYWRPRLSSPGFPIYRPARKGGGTIVCVGGRGARQDSNPDAWIRGLAEGGRINTENRIKNITMNSVSLFL